MKPLKSPTASQLEARRRMDTVMNRIEAAQRLIGDACEAMCPITPLCDDWERLGRLYDAIKAEWRRLNGVRNGSGYDLDPDAKAAFEARQADKVPVEG